MHKRSFLHSSSARVYAEPIGKAIASRPLPNEASQVMASACRVAGVAIKAVRS